MNEHVGNADWYKSTMSWHVVLGLMAGVLSYIPAPAQEVNFSLQKVLLKKGHVFELVLVTPLDSSRTSQGDDIAFAISHGFTVGNETILPATWTFHTHVSHVSRAGPDCTAGSVYFRLESVAAPAGEEIKLRFIDKSRATEHGKLVESVAPDYSPKASRPSQKSSVAKRALWALARPPLVIAASPIWIPAVISISAQESKKCHGKPGLEYRLPAGERFYVSVTEDTLISVSNSTSTGNANVPRQ